LKWALWGVAGLGAAAVVYIMVKASTNPERGDGLKTLARGEMSKLVAPADAAPAPANTFYDVDGKAVRLADFKGKVVVLNLWATWCGPCIIEMPTLAKLQAAYVGKPVEVVAVSLDSDKDRDKARAFIAQHAPLKFYADPRFKLPFAFTPPATAMPATIIFGADGVQRGRLAGGADWSGPDARAVIDKVLGES